MHFVVLHFFSTVLNRNHKNIYMFINCSFPKASVSAGEIRQISKVEITGNNGGYSDTKF